MTLFCGLLCAAAIALGCANSPSAPADGPVLVVLIDTLRPDHLGCYGYPLATSPHIDALATEARIYTNARSVSSWTKPAIPSLFTSLYPTQHTVFEGDAHGPADRLQSDVLPGSAWTLAEAFAERGHDTAAFVHNAQLRAEFGFSQGFDLYAEGPRAAAPMVDELRQWLQHRSHGNWFAYLHLLDVHWPYEPTPKSLRAVGGSPGEDIDRATIEAVNAGARSLGPEEIARIVSRYDAEIRDVDAALGPLFDDLRSRADWDSLTLVVTSDHGEAFGEHGKIGHGHDLFEQTLRIPLIIKFPHGRARGTTSDEPAGLVDVMPTALNTNQPEFEGIDLTSHSGRIERPRQLVAELRHGMHYEQALLDGNWKLIRSWVGANDPTNPLLLRRVEIEGTPRSNDEFSVREIELESGDDGDDELTGPVTRDSQGTLVVLGRRIATNSAKITDGAQQRILEGDLLVGTMVKVEGRSLRDSSFEADRIRQLDSDDDVEIEGLIRSTRRDPGSGDWILRVAGFDARVPPPLFESLLAGPGPSQARTRPVLYDLHTDPHERTDVALANPEIADSAMDALDQWLVRARETGLDAPPRARIDDETLEALRSLGYVD